MVRVIQDKFSGSGDALLIQNSYKETKRVKRVKAPLRTTHYNEEAPSKYNFIVKLP